MKQRLIILITGGSCAGKDYCAGIWVSAITTCTHSRLTVRAVSISDTTKREYSAPVAAFWHLVPDSRLIEIRVEASEKMWQARRIFHGEDDCSDKNEDAEKVLTHRPNFIFANNTPRDEAAKNIAEEHLFPFFHDDLRQLASMVRQVPDFPCPGKELKHVLGISQNPGGLDLCTFCCKATSLVIGPK